MSSEPDLCPDWLDFIDLLVHHGVKFVIVGAFALAFHRTPRATGDIDFLYERSEDNSERLERVLKDFGFGSLGISVKSLMEPNTMFALGVEPNRIDLMNWISGVEFEEAWSERVYADLKGRNLPFLSLSNLLKNKIAAGRAKDMDDIDKLQAKLRREQNG